MMANMLLVATLATVSATCSDGVMKLVAVNGTLPEPRECVQTGLKMEGLVKDYQCTASTLREACNAVGHPNVFGWWALFSSIFIY